ncbi:MAG: M15 family metallopeptidase [Candidatus Nanopelagicales bacterium]|nr:M15 family metallopeptidase [Candidatus Nanopelagicales bacterium]
MKASWVCAVALLAACASPTPTPPASPVPTPTPAVTRKPPPQADARIRRIPDAQWEAMRSAGVVRPGCPARRADLRRVEVNFRSWKGGVKRGSLVVNRDVAEDVAAIFSDIFDARFPIRSMRPIEEFGGDDNASMAADNTSAYNCRQASQANSAAADSPHANGRAVDINPRENPWLDPRCDCFMPTARHAARTAGKGKILEGGPVWRAFTKRGWIWQDIATPDYQHFDTGYPSRPR